MVYWSSPCPRGEERSDEPCGHGERPTADRVSAHRGRRRAWPKLLSCPFIRTVDGASAAQIGTLAFARQEKPHGSESSTVPGYCRCSVVCRNRRSQREAGFSTL